MATLIPQSKHKLLWVIYGKVEVIYCDEICGKDRVKIVLRHLT